MRDQSGFEDRLVVHVSVALYFRPVGLRNIGTGV